MNFKVYKKIQGLHKEECDGLLVGECIIQEKIDGANASIWMGDDGEIHYGSRSRDLFLAQDNFNGFGDYVKSHQGIKDYLTKNPTHRLYGEWLVRHTIGYNETSYKHFYMFEIEENDVILPIEKVYEVGEEYGIKTAYLFGKYTNPTLELIKEFAGKSVLGDKVEGVVVKNLGFINKFGDYQHGKYVTQDFKEDNAITFGGNNKSSETYNEMYYVNKYMTLPRVQKIIYKLEAMEGRPEMKHIPQVMGMAYHDLITEEAWSIAKEMAKAGKFFDFKAFEQFCNRKSKQIFIEIITNNISVAHG